MKTMRLIVFLCASLFSLTTYSAYIGNRAGAATLSLNAGYEFFSSKRHIENAAIPIMGIIGYDFTDQWGIEGMLAFLKTDFKKSIDDRRGISGNLFAVDGVYRFNTCSRIQPYVLAGVGITGLSPNHNDSTNEGNANVGLGVQLFADEIVAFRVEARDFYTFVGGKHDFVLDGGVTFLLDFCCH